MRHFSRKVNLGGDMLSRKSGANLSEIRRPIRGISGGKPDMDFDPQFPERRGRLSRQIILDRANFEPWLWPRFISDNCWTMLHLPANFYWLNLTNFTMLEWVNPNSRMLNGFRTTKCAESQKMKRGFSLESARIKRFQIRPNSRAAFEIKT